MNGAAVEIIAATRNELADPVIAIHSAPGTVPESKNTPKLKLAVEPNLIMPLADQNATESDRNFPGLRMSVRSVDGGQSSQVDEGLIRESSVKPELTMPSTEENALGANGQITRFYTAVERGPLNASKDDFLRPEPKQNADAPSREK